jgi:hypothetical protein
MFLVLPTPLAISINHSLICAIFHDVAVPHSVSFVVYRKAVVVDVFADFVPDDVVVALHAHDFGSFVRIRTSRIHERKKDRSRCT